MIFLLYYDIIIDIFCVYDIIYDILIYSDIINDIIYIYYDFIDDFTSTLF